MARGVEGRDIFLDDGDRRAFLAALDRITRQAGATVYAYCLMSNHFHLAIKVGAVSLTKVMHRLLTFQAITFNKKYDRAGHLFQARYAAILCLDDAYMLGIIRYIQDNPVRAGLVSKPEDWPWSSRSPLKLPDLDRDFDPWQRASERPTLLRVAPPKPRELQEISRETAHVGGTSVFEIRSRSCRRVVIRARRRLTAEALRSGYRLAEIARWLNVSHATARNYAGKSCETCESDPHLK